ncbi:MAG: M23 family metallopeptidase [Acidimicrobiia bacterium]
MNTPLVRCVARFAALALIAVALLASVPTALAAPETDEDAFVLTVFPHDTTAVNFWDSWGARRSGGRGHTGTDILSPRGTEILAAADGVVTGFGSARLSGYFIRLDHGDGWTTSYMHLNNDTVGTDDGAGGLWTAVHPTIVIGTEVNAGDVIGYVGDSGNAENTRPHTHFEVKKDGEKINPYPFLKDVFERERRLGVPGLPI